MIVLILIKTVFGIRIRRNMKDHELLSMVKPVFANNLLSQHYLEIQALSAVDPSQELTTTNNLENSIQTNYYGPYVVLISVIIFVGLMTWMLFSRIKDFNRLYTALAIALVIGSFPVAMGLISQSTRTTSQATQDSIPLNLIVTDVKSTEFTVSWITKEPAASMIRMSDHTDPYAADPVYQNPQPNTNHNVVVRDVNPNTTYYFVIVSNGIIYDYQGKPIQVTTTAD